MHSIMGRRIGLSWIDVCDSAQTKHNLNRIVEGYSKEVVDLGPGEVRVIDPTLFDENEPIGLFSERHKAKDVIARGRIRLDPQPSDKRDYRLQCSVSVL